MSARLSNLLGFIFLILVILTIFEKAIASSDKKNDGSVQTCSKDDEICRNAAKTKESSESVPNPSPDTTGADTKTKASEKLKESTDPKKSDESKPSKKTKSKSESEVADCPLCSYTRPLVKRIMEWIRELLSDPMMIMAFEFFKEKIWELGKMTKQLFGFRLF